ncbi:MAG: FHA domain-containing protein [Bacteriovoracales bacterium]|nr:FHA domain-containing protein [Bacteriovoracales bacterium]
MGNVIVLKNYQLTTDPGRHHRIVCMTGEKRGEVYYIKSKRILLGRGKDADIPIYDSQSSREHAELSRVGNYYVITDLNSNNGVIINGKKTKQAQLKSKDRIIIGKTVYKYEVVTVEDKNAAEHLSPRDEDEDEDELDHTPKGPKKKKNMLLILALVLGVVFFLPGEKSKKRGPTSRKKPIDIEFGLKKPRNTQRLSTKDLENKKRIDILIQKGIREMREGNYYRSIAEFDLALVVDPKHPRALTYKRKATDLQDEEIDAYFDQAFRDFNSFHYEKAIKNYCQIIKIFEHSPEDERRKSAKKNLEQLVDKFGVEKSATDCY